LAFCDETLECEHAPSRYLSRREDADRAGPGSRTVDRIHPRRITLLAMAAMTDTTEKPTPKKHFIQEIIDGDNASGKHQGRVRTRFPPEPNGYLHIGHAKSICLNFGLAEQYGGQCNLRFDDTNPTKEEEEYVESIQEDVRWLGFEWHDRPYFASEYFDQLFDWAIQLIKAGKAYVCDLSADEIREYRGTPTAPGRNSPFRDRTVEQNLALFLRMKAGEFPDGARTLRAKIDMAAPNLNLRDPVMYRILHATHHRTGDKWCIYPMYDYTHGQSDSIEGITHSICTLEFEDHRPLYDWFIEQLGIHHPQQIEFARLNLTYMVMSKRKLLELVTTGCVSGWDDPRMPTLRGLRRRGYTPESLRNFCADVGVAKYPGTIDILRLENAIREDLNRRANRVMAVLQPLKLVITNFPVHQVEYLDAINNPENPLAGSRQIPFSRELFIERDDFMIEPPKKFFRLAPGSEVRLRYGYIIKCEGFQTDPATGEVTEVHCSYDPETRSGMPQANRKVKGTLHWVSAPHSVAAEVRLYDHLFSVEHPDDVPEGTDYKANLNPQSLVVRQECRLEPSLQEADGDDRFQFERQGYFCLDARDSRPDSLVFNRTVPLRDSWSKLVKKGSE